MEDDNALVWVEEFDLSVLTYEQFTAFFFDRPIVSSEEQYDLFQGEIDDFVASDTAAVVRNMLRTFQNWGELAEIYSYEQMEQGSSFGMLGHPVDCNKYLYDDQIPLQLRIECIEAMYSVFTAFKTDPAQPADIHDESVMDNYYMWWHNVLWDLWFFAEWKKRADIDYAHLDDDLRQIVDACFRTLVRILAIDHRYSQVCALHGLGHSKHPQARETVQRYLDQHRDKLTLSEIKYAEYCREGRII